MCQKEKSVLEPSIEEIRYALRSACGTMNYWKLFPNNNAPMMTDGVKTMAELCKAYWLVYDIIAYQVRPEVRNESFQVWKLIPYDENKAKLYCDDGNHRELLSVNVKYTDFPLPEGIKLYLTNGVLLLPSEY